MTTAEASTYNYSEVYPSMNRTPTGLGPIDIEVVDDRGARLYDPNKAILAAHKGPKGFSLGAPITTSDISNEPGYVVRFDAVQLSLTAPELVRLCMKSLRPEEFFALARKYGVFYEICSKFYDEDTGVALDARLTYEEQQQREDLAYVPHLLVIPGDQPTVHSVLTLDEADRLIPELARIFVLRTVALLLNEPTLPSVDRVLLKPVGNIVTVFTYDDDSMRAYGPFNTVKEAESFIPADHPAARTIKSQHTSSSIVASCGSVSP